VGRVAADADADGGNRMTTRWGVIATGRIAATVVEDMKLVDGAVLAAVASRDLGRARAFADEHGFERAYGSYEELIADPDLDAVYVATPHAQHHSVVRPLLEAGKSVLCEKSMTCTPEAAQDLVDLARERGLFLMEAMWTRFNPAVVALRELVESGGIGELRTVEAELGFPVDPSDTGGRLLDPAQGGGALLDVGVYPVAFAQMLLGTPETIATTGVLASTGVDADVALLLGWADGRKATLVATLATPTSERARLLGTTGWIEVEGSFIHPQRFEVHRHGVEEPEVVERPFEGRGYQFQVIEVQRCLAEGLTESPSMPLDDTLAISRTIDTALTALGATRADQGFSPA
jgi:predicted dehydrogenase